MVCRSMVCNSKLNSNGVQCTLSKSSKYRLKETCMVCRSMVCNLNLNSNGVHCTLSRSSRFRFKEPFHSLKVNGVQFKDLLSLLIMEKNIILSAIFLIGCFCRLFAPKIELKFVTQGRGNCPI